MKVAGARDEQRRLADAPDHPRALAHALGAAHPDRGRRHAIGADRPPAGGAGDAVSRFGMSVAGLGHGDEQPTIAADGRTKPSPALRHRGRRACSSSPASSASSTAPRSAAPGKVEDALGIFAVNGWVNVLHIAHRSARPAGRGLRGTPVRALAREPSTSLLAIWGFALGGGDSILGFLPGQRRRRPPPPGPRRCSASAPRWRRRSRSTGASRLQPDPAGQRAQAAFGLLAAAAPNLEEHERASRDAPGADGDHRAHPVARVAQRPQLALGELLGPVGELLGGSLGDGGEGVLDPAREPLRAARSAAARRRAAARRPRCCRSGAALVTHRSSPPEAA